jgi:hypothetical protein
MEISVTGVRAITLFVEDPQRSRQFHESALDHGVICQDDRAETSRRGVGLTHQTCQNPGAG